MTPTEYNEIINAIEWFYAEVPDWEQTRYWELFKIIQRLGGPKLFKLIVNDYKANSSTPAARRHFFTNTSTHK